MHDIYREVKPSPIQGKGMFAKTSIPTGTALSTVQGKVIAKDAVPLQPEGEEDNYLQIDEEHFLELSRTNRGYMNHSCEPNTYVRIGRTVEVVALRDIQTGEELTFDYSLTADENDWSMHCSCGSKYCRKEIRDFKHLPKMLREQYNALGIVPAYLQKYV